MSSDTKPTAMETGFTFDWLPEPLPAGAWDEAMRAYVSEAIRIVGWDAVHRGEFGPLERLYREFVSVLPRLMVDRSDADRAAALYTVLHIMIWRRTQLLSELKPFNRDVVQPFAAYLSRHFAKQAPRPSGRTVPRIAYLSETSDLFGSNAVARVTVSLMLGQQALRAREDRPVLYCINRPFPNLMAFAEEHDLLVRDMARRTASACVAAILEQMAADEIDILIADSNCAVATMVMQRRPARVQAFHENGFSTWAIPELDLALLGITPPSADLFTDGVVMAQTPRNTSSLFHYIEQPAATVDAVRGVMLTESGVADPSVIYGFYGRMAKVTADYMRQVEAILLRDPRAIFFAGGTGRSSPVYACKHASPVGDRMVIYNDFIDGHVVSECIDVFLDTFPFPGGLSCAEAQAHGVPVVWLTSGSEDRPLIVDDQRDGSLGALDVDDYVAIAGRLADPDMYARASAAAVEIPRRFTDMRMQAEMVEEHLRTAWARVRDDVRAAA